MNLEKGIFETIETKWDEFRRNVLNWQNKRHNAERIKVNSVREHSIRILQNRYGYSREEAAYQLDKYYSRAWLG
jgi:hypothetical protein